jgi:dienelactone hydrolase
MFLGLSMLACSASAPSPSASSEPTSAAGSPREIGVEVVCPAEPRPLAATWLRPTGSGPFPTAVILVGARSWNRWGDQPDAPWGHYRDIALGLVKAGAAVLVYDKSGTGSTGGPTVALPARVAEAHSALACALTQPGADPERVVFLGHSQGSLVATLAAIQGAPVQGLVLLSPVVEVDALAALPDGLAMTLVRGEIEGAATDDKRLQMLVARGLPTRHVVIPNADHLLLDNSVRIPKPADPTTQVHPAALRAIADAVTSVGRSVP